MQARCKRYDKVFDDRDTQEDSPPNLQYATHRYQTPTCLPDTGQTLKCAFLILRLLSMNTNYPFMKLSADFIMRLLHARNFEQKKKQKKRRFLAALVKACNGNHFHLQPIKLQLPRPPRQDIKNKDKIIGESR